MNTIIPAVKFLKEYNRLLERGIKNIYDNPEFIWVDKLIELIEKQGLVSLIPDLFSSTIKEKREVLSLKKPILPTFDLSFSFRESVKFNFSNLKFESDSEDELISFLNSEEGRTENDRLTDYKNIKEIYSKLFKVQSETKNDSNLEFVLSVGLIQSTRQTERNDKISNPKINQHLFHFPLSIELDKNNASIIVRFSNEDKPYTDAFFLNNTQIDKKNLDEILEKFENKIEELGFEYLFEEEFREQISKHLLRISSKTIFKNSLLKPKTDSSDIDAFNISYSPAINIKTKRPRFFEKLTESIIKHNSENEIEAPLFNLLLRNSENTNSNKIKVENFFTDEFYPKYQAQNNNLDISDFTTFFPLASNNEQKEIFEKHIESRLTVIAGPPGTGKSHSIVNLLCCLIAQGKKVLVTAQTDKALESLLAKIPTYFDNLVFTKVRLANNSRFSLEKSIESITEILSRKPASDIDENWANPLIIGQNF